MAGFGRTGKWFAIDHFDVTPDLITFAKGVTSGYVPLGGVAISPAIAETFAHRAYPGGLTYSGHPLATAAAVATINAMEDEGMVANAARIGEEILGPGLADIAENAPVNGTVELGGPERFELDELIRRFLRAKDDSRPVVTDVHAPYYGIEVDERDLIPGDDSRIGPTRFADWLSQSAVPTIPAGPSGPARK